MKQSRIMILLHLRRIIYAIKLRSHSRPGLSYYFVVVGCERVDPDGRRPRLALVVEGEVGGELAVGHAGRVDQQTVEDVQVGRVALRAVDCRLGSGGEGALHLSGRWVRLQRNEDVGAAEGGLPCRRIRLGVESGSAWMLQLMLSE